MQVKVETGLYFAIRDSRGYLKGQLGVTEAGLEWWPHNAREARKVSWETAARLIEENRES